MQYQILDEDSHIFRATFYVANKWKNEFMQRLDARKDYEWFVEPVLHEISTWIAECDREDFFLEEIIEKSRPYKDFWVPGVLYCGVIYHPEDVKIISDGKKLIFL